MAAVSRQIIAIGGGKITSPQQPAAIRKYLYNLIPKEGNTDLKICLLPQARFGSSDFEAYITNFKSTFEQTGFKVTIIRLHGSMDFDKLRETMLSSQIIYVCGGSTLTLLAVWRAWRIDTILRQAYENGVILAGDSAGAICWFEQCVSSARKDSSIISGLGFLPGACCPHFDSKETPKSYYLKSIRDSSIYTSPRYAINDYTAAHFVDEQLVKGLVWENSNKQMPNPNASLFSVNSSGLTSISCQEERYPKSTRGSSN